MQCMAQFSLGGTNVIGSGPVSCLGGYGGGDGCDGDGLVRDGFEVSLGSCQRGRAQTRRRRLTIACALVVQVLRNSIRETAALYGTFKWYSRRMFTPRTALYTFSINSAAKGPTRRARLQRLERWVRCDMCLRGDEGYGEGMVCTRGL